MTEINDIPLAERILATRDSIFKHGVEHFDITRWFGAKNDAGLTQDFSLGLIDENCEPVQFNIDHCGSTGCIAGHCSIAASQLGVTVDSASLAGQWLGLQTDVDPFMEVRE